MTDATADRRGGPVNRGVVVLARALDQAGDTLAAVHVEDLHRPTPCGDWKVSRLVGHVTDAPRRFLAMMAGESPQWSAPTQSPDEDWTARFRIAADDLVHAWHETGEDGDVDTVDWQTAELAVHTWDLVTATGQDRPLDPEVAERALAFLTARLTPANRGEGFGPEVRVPADAPVQDRLAAFAGRHPG